jgi:hypothetical protein
MTEPAAERQGVEMARDIREFHVPDRDRGATYCVQDSQQWPCDAHLMADAYEQQTAELERARERIAALKAALTETMLDWQVHYEQTHHEVIDDWDFMQRLRAALARGRGGEE